ERLRRRRHVEKADQGMTLASAHSLVEMKQSHGLPRRANPTSDPSEEPDKVGRGLGDLGVVRHLSIRNVDRLVYGLVKAHLQLADNGPQMPVIRIPPTSS